MATGDRNDPSPTFTFSVSVEDWNAAEFSECSGLEMTTKFDEVREGGENGYVHKLAGRIEYGNLILKRGFARGTRLVEWCLRPRRCDVTVALIRPRAEGPLTIAEWVFHQAYPVKWSGPALKASDNSVAIETLELAHCGLLANGGANGRR
jgi:phage tail-like protein